MNNPRLRPDWRERLIRRLVLWRIRRRYGFKVWADAPDAAMHEWTAFIRWRCDVGGRPE